MRRCTRYYSSTTPLVSRFTLATSRIEAHGILSLVRDHGKAVTRNPTTVPRIQLPRPDFLVSLQRPGTYPARTVVLIVRNYGQNLTVLSEENNIPRIKQLPLQKS